MINVSNAFKDAIIADVRRTYVKVIAHIIDPDLIMGVPTYSDVETWADPAEIADENTGNLPYATFENNQWLLDGSMILAPDTALDSGFVSNDMADNVRDLTSWVQLNFSGVQILQTCVIVFDENESNGVPGNFTVEILQAGGTVAHTETITGNQATTVNVSGFTVNSPVGIRVTCVKMSIPYRRMRVAEIIPGVHETWTGDDLAALEIKQQIDLTNANLPCGTCILALDNSTKRFDPRNKSGLFLSLEDRQGIDVFIGAGNPAEYVKMGHYYMAPNGWKTTLNAITLQWQLVDVIGLIMDRPFAVPGTLPTTLEGWIAEIMAQFDDTFDDKYIVDPSIASFACVCADDEMIAEKTSGEILRYLLEYAGCTATATADGELYIKPIGNVDGNSYDLDNLNGYPEIAENNDVAAVVVTIQNSLGDSKVTFGGTKATANESRTIDNPFINNNTDAQRVAFYALQFYGGMVYSTIGRGNPSSELCDIDNLTLDESNAASGRRYYQDFKFQNGVLMGCSSQLLQADGALTYSNYQILTTAQTYTFPAGVTSARILLVGGGYSGGKGQDGTYSRAGADGEHGSGGKIFVDEISFADGASFAVTIGAAEGGNSTFGAYTSENGAVYPTGYGDLITGNVYGRTGVLEPLANSGDGGRGGAGGRKGERHIAPDHKGYIIDVEPGSGKNGKPGASGCVVVYWSE